MASKKILVQLDIQAASNLTSPLSGFVGFSAKADGLYQKIGTSPELRLLTSADVQNAILADGSITGAVSQAQIFTMGVKLYNLTQGYIPYASGTTKLLSNSPIYTDGTNVGIGTTTPGKKLSVGLAASSNGVDGDILSSALATGTGYGSSMIWNMYVAGGNANSILAKIQPSIYQPTRSYLNSLDFFVGDWNNNNDAGTAKMTIQSGGNVGIGTPAPNQQLEITKNFRLPSTAGTTPYGIIYKDGSRFIHNFNYGNNGTVTTYGNNTFIGINAGNFTMGSTATQNYNGSFNTGIGVYSLFSNTTGNSNTAIGCQSLCFNTTGFSNTGIGYNSLLSNTTGYNNAAIGVNSLFSNTTGYNNTAIGFNSLFSNDIGDSNCAIGVNSLYNNTTGYNNTAIGFNAGSSIANGTARTTGNNGIYLGYNSKASANGTDNEIVIGYNAIGQGSNTIQLGNTSILRTYAKGLNLGAGTATAGTAPLKFTSGVNLTTPEAGAMEFSSSRLYFTPSSTRETIAFLSDITSASHAAVTIGAIGSTPNANGMSISGQTLSLQPASALYGGVLTNSAQTISGAKTLSSLLTASAGIANNGSYTQTGTSENTFTGTSTFSNATYSALFTGGNVGIGTTGPATQLHLSGAGADQRVAGGNYTNTIRLTDKYTTAYGSGGELQFGYSDTGANSVLSTIKGSYDIYGLTSSGGGLHFFTKPADTGLVERLTIKYDGNVGIGTTNPGAYKLNVNGNTNITGNLNISGLTASKVVFTDSSKNLTSTGIGTASQFIKGDGSLDSNTYLTTGTTIHTGSGVDGRVTFWNGSNSLSSSANLTWDNTSSRLFVNSISLSNSFNLGTSTTAGYVLTTDAYGNGTWQAPTGGSYTLPTATASVLGVVKIGSGITISSGAISVSTNYQAPITTGTTAQYLRGDLSLATFPTIHTGNGFNGGVTFWNGSNSMFAATELTWNNTSKYLSVTGTVSANNFSSISMSTNTLSTNTFRLIATTTAGYVLTTDANGNGTWQAPGGSITGSGVSGRITFWNGTNSLSSTSDLEWNSTTKNLGVTGGIVANSVLASISMSTNSLSTNSFRLIATTTAGYVLTTDANGNGTWQAPTGSLSGFVPYEGATMDVDLGSKRLTAGSICVTTSPGAGKVLMDVTGHGHGAWMSLSGGIPVASTTVLGGIKVGSGLGIANEVLYVDPSVYVPYTNATSNVNLGSCSIFAYDFLISSDINLKCNIENIEYKDLNIDYKKFEFKKYKGKKRYGVIAQELLDVAPEFVEKEDDFYSVKYIDLLVYEIAQLKHEISQLKSQLCQ